MPIRTLCDRQAEAWIGDDSGAIGGAREEFGKAA